MVEFLLGVPGRLVALGTSLATGISDILTAIGTRAPAGTAVSNAVLTDARIGNLDNLALAPLRIKRIVSGSIQIPPTATNASVSTGVAFDPNKTVLLHQGGYLSVTGTDQTVSTAVELNVNGTQLIVRRSGALAHWVMVRYQLIELW